MRTYALLYDQAVARAVAVPLTTHIRVLTYEEAARLASQPEFALYQVSAQTPGQVDATVRTAMEQGAILAREALHAEGSAHDDHGVFVWFSFIPGRSIAQISVGLLGALAFAACRLAQQPHSLPCALAATGAVDIHTGQVHGVAHLAAKLAVALTTLGPGGHVFYPHCQASEIPHALQERAQAGGLHLHAVATVADAVAQLPDRVHVRIVTPAHATILRIGTTLQLYGEATSAWDGPLPPDALLWESSRDGPLGCGTMLASVLRTPGLHQLTLTATSARGRVATAVATVRVDSGGGALVRRLQRHYAPWAVRFRTRLCQVASHWRRPLEDASALTAILAPKAGFSQAARGTFSRRLCGMLLLGSLLLLLGTGWQVLRYATALLAPLHAVRITSGTPGLTFHMITEGLIEALRPAVHAWSVQSPGAEENLRRLCANEAELGLVHAHITPPPGCAITMIAELFDSVLHLLTPQRTRLATMEDVARAPEVRIAMGPDGSGTKRLCQQLLQVYQLPVPLVAVPVSTWEQQLRRLEHEELDLACFVSAYPVPFIRQLSGMRYHFVQMTDLARLQAHDPALRAYTLPANAYGDRPPFPATAVTTLSIPTVLVASPAFSQRPGATQVFFDITQRLQEHRPLILKSYVDYIPAGSLYPGYPLHQGAQRYFEAGSGARPTGLGVELLVYSGLCLASGSGLLWAGRRLRTSG